MPWRTPHVGHHTPDDADVMADGAPKLDGRFEVRETLGGSFVFAAKSEPWTGYKKPAAKKGTGAGAGAGAGAGGGRRGGGAVAAAKGASAARAKTKGKASKGAKKEKKALSEQAKARAAAKAAKKAKVRDAACHPLPRHSHTFTEVLTPFPLWLPPVQRTKGQEGDGQDRVRERDAQGPEEGCVRARVVSHGRCAPLIPSSPDDDSQT